MEALARMHVLHLYDVLYKKKDYMKIRRKSAKILRQSYENHKAQFYKKFNVCIGLESILNYYIQNVKWG